MTFDANATMQQMAAASSMAGAGSNLNGLGGCLGCICSINFGASQGVLQDVALGFSNQQNIIPGIVHSVSGDSKKKPGLLEKLLNSISQELAEGKHKPNIGDSFSQSASAGPAASSGPGAPDFSSFKIALNASPNMVSGGGAPVAVADHGLHGHGAPAGVDHGAHAFG